MNDPLACLLVILGGMTPVGLLGCATDFAHPFRTVDAGADAGVDADANATPPDAGPDTPPIICPTKLVGYATLVGDGGVGTTGGGDAGTVVATTLEELRTYLRQVGPAIVKVSGTINNPTPTSPVEVESDKTILPVRYGDGLTGAGLLINKVHNVIVRNLTIAKAVQPSDAVTIQSSNNVWVDHCDLSSDLVMPKGYYDGLVDIVHGSYNVTVSWNYLHDHYNPSLVGHTDTPTSGNTEDLALAATFHHNWFQRTSSGAPRARFGHVHLFSNHYSNVDSYAIASVMGAALRIEGNVFDNTVVTSIVTHIDGTPVDGTIADVGNLYSPAAAPMPTTAPNNWTPPYAYADSVDPVNVDSCAGVGKVP